MIWIVTTLIFLIQRNNSIYFYLLFYLSRMNCIYSRLELVTYEYMFSMLKLSSRALASNTSLKSKTQPTQTCSSTPPTMGTSRASSWTQRSVFCQHRTPHTFNSRPYIVDDSLVCTFISLSSHSLQQSDVWFLSFAFSTWSWTRSL